MRRILLAMTMVAAATTFGAGTATAAAPPAKPAVTASVGTLNGPTAPITYSVNRGIQQVASVTYSLNGAAVVPAPAPTAAGKSASGGSFDVTAAEGQNTLTVTVNLTDGGTATSNQVTFAYTAVDPYAAVRAGCEAMLGGVFTIGDDPGTDATERFYCTTAIRPPSFPYLGGVFAPACFDTGGNSSFTNALDEQATVSYYGCYLVG